MDKTTEIFYSLRISSIIWHPIEQLTFYFGLFNRVKLVRLGHPARLLPQVLESALDAQVLDTTAFAYKIQIIGF